MSRRLLLAPLAALLLTTVPATASATTTATRAGTAITIAGDDGPNYISVNNVGNFIMYEDTTGGSIVAGAGCFQESPTLINCGVGGPGLVATITLGAGDDTYRDGMPRTDWPRVDLDAGDGNDDILGSYTGDDVLRGGAGNDKLYGAKGRDQIDGGPGDDLIHGGAGDDTVTGGPGRDSLYGDGDWSGAGGLDGGNDTIQARDGELDQVACGFGGDIAVLDTADVVDNVVDCEQVDRPAAPPAPAPTTPAPAPSPGGSPQPPAALTVAVGKPASLKLGPLAAGKALAFTATVSASCAATVTLKVAAAEARRVGLGRKAVVLASVVRAAGGGRLAVKLTVKKAYRIKLKRARSVKATISVACAGASGAKATTSLPLTLRR